MKILLKLFVFLAIATQAIASPQDTDFSQRSKPATMKVLLHRQVPEFVLEVKGRHHVFNPFDGTEISSGIIDRRYPVIAEEFGIKWGDKFPGCSQLRVVPDNSTSSILVNGIQYKGVIEIYLNDGKFNVINEVDVENYLKSTLSNAFSQPLHDEVLNAIAIVARTNAYHIANHNKQSRWYVAASDVGYRGSANLFKHHIDRAVEVTHQAILTYNNAPFAATWTENSAGKTATFADIFRKGLVTPPGVDAPLAAKNRHESKWSCTLTKELLAEATDLHPVTGVDLYVTPKAGKVYAVKVTGGSQIKDFDFATFQKIVGSRDLRSNDFTVQTHGDELVFTGFGSGSGCGLCLYSAKLMAEKGEKAPQILQAFFPETKMDKVKSLK